MQIHAVLEAIDEAHQPALPSTLDCPSSGCTAAASQPGTGDRLLDAVRRHLRSTLGTAATDVLMTGYRRKGE